MSDADDGAAHLFLSLLQARVGGSFTSRIEGVPLAGILQKPPGEVSRELRLSEKAAGAFGDLRRDFDAAALRERLSRAGVAALTMADDAYPARLRRVPDPPPALFVCASIELGRLCELAVQGEEVGPVDEVRGDGPPRPEQGIAHPTADREGL